MEAGEDSPFQLFFLLCTWFQDVNSELAAAAAMLVHHPSATESQNTLHHKLPWSCVLPHQQKTDRRTLGTDRSGEDFGRGFYQLTLALRQGSCDSHRRAPNMSFVLLGTPPLCPLYLMQM